MTARMSLDARNRRRRAIRRQVDQVPDGWASATSLADLGDVNVRWLRGELPRLPNYLAAVDVDEHLAPGLTDALIAANRAGYVTDNSQGGAVFSATSRQLAWVSGVASPEFAARLAAGARRAGFEAHVWRRWDRRRTVTWDDGRPFTRDGWASPLVVATHMFPDLDSAGRAAVLAAQQFSLVDPVPGRNTLWRWLAAESEAFTTARSVRSV